MVRLWRVRDAVSLAHGAMVPPLDPASPVRSRQNTLAHDSTEREAHRDRSLGDGTVGVRRPVLGLMRNGTTVSEF